MLPEFQAGRVALEVIESLERRRLAIADDEAKVRAAALEALAPLEKDYRADDLPMSYFTALKQEILATVPARWHALAQPFTEREKTAFGIWRGGDVPARLAYVLLGLVLGGFIVWAPFIPIWEKWFPFVLAFAAWWLPDLQQRWHRRRYAKQLGELVELVGRAQPALDRHVDVGELLADNNGNESRPALAAHAAVRREEKP